MAQGQRLRSWFAWTAIVVAFQFACPLLSHSQGLGLGPRRDSICYARVTDFRLLSAGSGWAIVDEPLDHPKSYEDCESQHLYWTDDDGKTWRDITPPHMPTRHIGKPFFLDRTHGWTIATDALNEDPDARFYLYSTDDNGKTWRILLMQRSSYNLMDDIFPSYIKFVDPQHGWMLWRWAMMNSRVNALLATGDGGHTWHRLPDPPGPGPIDFISTKDGWMVGRSEVPDGIPYYENEQVWATHDGGLHWRALPLSLPSVNGEDQLAGFSTVRFKDANQGIAIACARFYAQGPSDLSQCFAYFTHNGGRAWRPSPSDDSSAYRMEDSVVGLRIVWFLSDFDSENVMIQKRGHTVMPVFPDHFPARTFYNAEFIDDRDAWVAYLGQRETVDASGQTLFPNGILSSQDGGKTFRAIGPPAAAKSARITASPLPAQ